jgi:hypothetical protein
MGIRSWVGGGRTPGFTNHINWLYSWSGWLLRQPQKWLRSLHCFTISIDIFRLLLEWVMFRAGLGAPQDGFNQTQVLQQHVAAASIVSSIVAAQFLEGLYSYTRAHPPSKHLEVQQAIVVRK